MVKKILKFGGTSVGTIERIEYVANIIKKEHDNGNQVIAVVSAMSGKTNELIKFTIDDCQKLINEINSQKWDKLPEDNKFLMGLYKKLFELGIIPEEVNI